MLPSTVFVSGPAKLLHVVPTVSILSVILEMATPTPAAKTRSTLLDPGATDTVMLFVVDAVVLLALVAPLTNDGNALSFRDRQLPYCECRRYAVTYREASS